MAWSSPWDHRAEQLKLQEQAGKPNARLNSGEARKRADNLQARLQKRLEELKLEAQISPLPPLVLGGLLVVPLGLLAMMTGRATASPTAPADTQGVAAQARTIVMEIERSLGFEPTDREVEKLGYDIESRVPGNGKLRFIEVKGRATGTETITITRNEILYSLNKPDDFILAIVEFDGESHRVHYIRRPFQREPDFGVTSVNYDFGGVDGAGTKTLISFALLQGKERGSARMTTATVTSKGQITLPMEIRRTLGLETGDRVEFVEIAPGEFLLKAATHDVRALKGILRKPSQPVSVEDMNAAIRKRASKR
jgi:AbrB family looped-hinge helix DNA binding protein